MPKLDGTWEQFNEWMLVRRRIAAWRQEWRTMKAAHTLKETESHEYQPSRKPSLDQRGSWKCFTCGQRFWDGQIPDGLQCLQKVGSGATCLAMRLWADIRRDPDAP